MQGFPFDPNPYLYRGERLREIAFPLGGIGTGCVSLEGRGALRDWELFGRPNKGSFLYQTFPVLWCRVDGESPDCRVVQGPRLKDWAGAGLGSYGLGTGVFSQGDGLPAFDETTFVGTFPSASIQFQRASHPVEVQLTAWSSFEPLEDRSSSMPIAVLDYEVLNVTAKPVELVLAWNLMNPIGAFSSEPEPANDGAWCEWRESGHFRGLVFGNDRILEGDEHAGTFALTTDHPDIEYSPRWYEGTWFDALQDFWNRFSHDGSLNSNARNETGHRMPGSLGLRARLDPNERRRLRFLFSWVIPFSRRYWDTKFEPQAGYWRKYYATVWSDAWAVADEFHRNSPQLEARTFSFRDHLFLSTLPCEVIESVAATATTLRTPTVERLEDGTLWAWEGCNGQSGCCHGSCSHVWNYALTHAMWFPELAKSMLRSHFRTGFDCGPAGELGAMNFRVMLPLSTGSPLWHAAIDGQMGLILQLHRTWKQTGDRSFLQELYPSAKKAMGYAKTQWDRDEDGLVDGDMHNTYDINFQGPNPLGQFFYLSALKALGNMAIEMGEPEVYERCTKLVSEGIAKAIEYLWNGEFFVQRLDMVEGEVPKYQHGIGCLSDQVFGVLCAKWAGIDGLIDPEIERKAILSVYSNNFRDPLGDYPNMQRVYAVGDEAGLLLCSWPNGGRPEFPFVYSDEVWTGIEYQVAAHLMEVGCVEEGLKILRAVRKRYDGSRRNPYNEFECGSHYARALASYATWLALTGLQVDGVRNELSGKPWRFQDGFRALYVSSKEWGSMMVEGSQLRFISA
jgi:uncharacterized protein (DUF608 family)